MKFNLLILLIPLFINSMNKLVYDPARPLDFPLKDSFTYPNCELLKDKSQEEKDAVLDNVLNDFRGDYNYPTRRHYMADLIRIGADQNVNKHFGPMNDALFFNDYYLLGLLIKQGADANDKIHSTPLIFYARTKCIAELLLQNGANINSQDSNETVLFAAMGQTHHFELIPFYKEKGLSPCDSNKYHISPLHKLVNSADQKESVIKAELLLNNL